MTGGPRYYCDRLPTVYRYRPLSWLFQRPAKRPGKRAKARYFAAWLPAAPPRPMTIEYRTWLCMRQRCYNPRHVNFKNYGDRGIKVCERWRVFSNFLADMGKRPPGMTLDRIDYDLGYSPENCRWATRLEQARNKRNTIWIEVNGWAMKFCEVAEQLRLDPGTLYGRIRNGWSVAAALSTPVRRKRRKSEQQPAA